MNSVVNTPFSNTHLSVATNTHRSGDTVKTPSNESDECKSFNDELNGALEIGQKIYGGSENRKDVTITDESICSAENFHETNDYANAANEHGAFIRKMLPYSVIVSGKTSELEGVLPTETKLPQDNGAAPQSNNEEDPIWDETRFAVNYSAWQDINISVNNFPVEYSSENLDVNIGLNIGDTELPVSIGQPEQDSSTKENDLNSVLPIYTKASKGYHALSISVNSEDLDHGNVSTTTEHENNNIAAGTETHISNAANIVNPAVLLSKKQPTTINTQKETNQANISESPVRDNQQDHSPQKLLEPLNLDTVNLDLKNLTHATFAWSSSTQSSTVALGSIPSDTAVRVDKAIEIRDIATGKSLSQVTIQIDDNNGAPDRIKLSVRGTALETTIAVSEVNRAEQMLSGSSDLKRSLLQNGFDSTVVKIVADKESHKEDLSRQRQKNKQQSKEQF